MILTRIPVGNRVRLEVGEVTLEGDLIGMPFSWPTNSLYVDAYGSVLEVGEIRSAGYISFFAPQAINFGLYEKVS